MSPSLIITLLTLHMIALMSPGPDFLIVVKNSLTHGRFAGICTAIGMAMGLSVHIGYSLLGLGYLISKSIIIFTGLKVIGGLYLLRIAYQSWNAKASSLESQFSQTHAAKNNREAFSNGFITNVFNPKATLYFLSIFTTLVSPDTDKASLIALGVVMMAMGAIWFSLVACFFATPTIRSRYDRSQTIINKVFGGILLLLGIKILTSK